MNDQTEAIEACDTLLMHQMWDDPLTPRVCVIDVPNRGQAIALIIDGFYADGDLRSEARLWEKHLTTAVAAIKRAQTEMEKNA